MHAMTPQKPKLPADARLLKHGEKTQKGDLEWVGNKWEEVIHSDIFVRQSRVGFYCRKIQPTQ